MTSPWDESETLAMAGHSDGKVNAWIVDDDKDGNFTKEKKFKGSESFVGPIGYIANFDLDSSDEPEIWIADKEGLHGLFYKNMIEYVTIETQIDMNSTFTVEGFNIYTTQQGEYLDSNGNSLKMIIVESGEFDPDTMSTFTGFNLIQQPS